MTLTTKYFTCMQCGGHELDDIGGDRFKCQSCGTVYEQDRIDEYEKIFEKFDEALRWQRSEDLAGLARRRYEETHVKKYVSNVEVERVCNKILDLNPDDFYSQFYIATCKEDCSLADFLCDLDVKKHYYDVEQMLGYLIRGLQPSWINAVSTLIEKAYKRNDIEKYNTYRTKFEEMADKVDNGMFEPTLPRDIFIAYSSKDMAKVNELLRVLEEENGLSCFVSARNLRHGAGAVEKYREAIETAIRNCQTVVFVSSANSRNSKCEALNELNYIKTNMPEMGRIELLAEDYRGIAIERIFTEFFDGLEYCTSVEEVAARYFDKANNLAEAKAEAQRKAKEEAERLAKEAEEKAFEEAQRRIKEAEDRAMAESQRRIKEAEQRAMAESQRRIKEKVSFWARAKAERQAMRELKLEAKEEARRKAREEAERLEREAAEREEREEAERLQKEIDEQEKKEQIEKNFEIENGVLLRYKGYGGDVVIPDGVKLIANNAFKSGSIKSVHIPGSVKEIGRYAFAECSALKSITIEKGLKSIGDYAFSKCHFEKINIPNSVKSIGNNAFEFCWLKSIYIPASVENIGTDAFFYTDVASIVCEARGRAKGWQDNWHRKSRNYSAGTSEYHSITWGCED